MSYIKFFLSPIAFSTIITNVTVIFLFLRNRVWLKRPYNVFILVLSFTDMITGIVMCLTPKIVFVEPVKIPSHWFIGFLYCKILWSRLLLFGLGSVSVYTCLFLTIERWTAICRPFKYRTRFSSKYLIVFVILIWVLGLGTSSMGVLDFYFVPPNSNQTTPSCEVVPSVPANFAGLISILSVAGKFVIPSVIILILYVMAVLKIRENDRRMQDRSTRAQSLKSVTKMAAASTAALVLCWLPNQTYFILVMYRQAQLYTDVHNISSIVVLLSSTLNPFIYGLWGKDFRAALKSALCCIGCAPDSVSKNTSAPINNAETATM